jgi:hypothetical protein
LDLCPCVVVDDEGAAVGQLHLGRLDGVAPDEVAAPESGKVSRSAGRTSNPVGRLDTVAA